MPSLESMKRAVIAHHRRCPEPTLATHLFTEQGCSTVMRCGVSTFLSKPTKPLNERGRHSRSPRSEQSASTATRSGS